MLITHLPAYYLFRYITLAINALKSLGVKIESVIFAP